MIVFRIIRYISIFLLISMISYGLNDIPTQAATSAVFGGHALFQVPCTCTSGLSADVFLPLYLNTTIPIGGALLSNYPTVVGKMWYLIHPGNYALGYYVPGSYPCAIGVEPYCFTLPTLGELIPYFTGTSP